MVDLVKKFSFCRALCGTKAILATVGISALAVTAIVSGTVAGSLNSNSTSYGNSSNPDENIGATLNILHGVAAAAGIGIGAICLSMCCTNKLISIAQNTKSAITHSRIYNKFFAKNNNSQTAYGTMTQP